MPWTLASLLHDLQLAFPDRKQPPETVALYARELTDIPLDTLVAAVQEVIRSHDRFPRIASIRAVAAERTLNLPSEAVALAQVEAFARASVHPDDLVKKALDAVGGLHAWRTTENPGITRSQFLNMYREVRAASLRDLAVYGFRKEVGR